MRVIQTTTSRACSTSAFLAAAKLESGEKAFEAQASRAVAATSRYPIVGLASWDEAAGNLMKTMRNVDSMGLGRWRRGRPFSRTKGRRHSRERRRLWTGG